MYRCHSDGWRAYASPSLLLGCMAVAATLWAVAAQANWQQQYVASIASDASALIPLAPPAHAQAVPQPHANASWIAATGTAVPLASSVPWHGFEAVALAAGSTLAASHVYLYVAQRVLPGADQLFLVDHARRHIAGLPNHTLLWHPQQACLSHTDELMLNTSAWLVVRAASGAHMTAPDVAGLTSAATELLGWPAQDVGLRTDLPSGSSAPCLAAMNDSAVLQEGPLCAWSHAVQVHLALSWSCAQRYGGLHVTDTSWHRVEAGAWQPMPSSAWSNLVPRIEAQALPGYPERAGRLDPAMPGLFRIRMQLDAALLGVQRDDVLHVAVSGAGVASADSLGVQLQARNDIDLQSSQLSDVLNASSMQGSWIITDVDGNFERTCWLLRHVGTGEPRAACTGTASFNRLGYQPYSSQSVRNAPKITLCTSAELAAGCSARDIRLSRGHACVVVEATGSAPELRCWGGNPTTVGAKCPGRLYGTAGTQYPWQAIQPCAPGDTNCTIESFDLEWCHACVVVGSRVNASQHDVRCWGGETGSYPAFGLTSGYSGTQPYTQPGLAICNASEVAAGCQPRSVHVGLHHTCVRLDWAAGYTSLRCLGPCTGNEPTGDLRDDAVRSRWETVQPGMCAVMGASAAARTQLVGSAQDAELCSPAELAAGCSVVDASLSVFMSCAVLNVSGAMDVRCVGRADLLGFAAVKGEAEPAYTGSMAVCSPAEQAQGCRPVQVSVGYAGACVLVRFDSGLQRVKCWGRNIGGVFSHVGATTSSSIMAPVDMQACAESEVSGLGCSATRVNFGFESICVRLEFQSSHNSTTAMRCWGLDNKLQLGYGAGLAAGLPWQMGNVPVSDNRYWSVRAGSPSASRSAGGVWVSERALHTLVQEVERTGQLQLEGVPDVPASGSASQRLTAQGLVLSVAVADDARNASWSVESILLVAGVEDNICVLWNGATQRLHCVGRYNEQGVLGFQTFVDGANARTTSIATTLTWSNWPQVELCTPVETAAGCRVVDLGSPQKHNCAIVQLGTGQHKLRCWGRFGYCTMPVYLNFDSGSFAGNDNNPPTTFEPCNSTERAAGCEPVQVSTDEYRTGVILRMADGSTRARVWGRDNVWGVRGVGLVDTDASHVGGCASSGTFNSASRTDENANQYTVRLCSAAEAAAGCQPVAAWMGSGSACFLLAWSDRQPTLRCTGHNGWGQLGYGLNTDYPSDASAGNDGIDDGVGDSPATLPEVLGDVPLCSAAELAAGCRPVTVSISPGQKWSSYSEAYRAGNFICFTGAFTNGSVFTRCAGNDYNQVPTRAGGIDKYMATYADRYAWVMGDTPDEKLYALEPLDQCAPGEDCSTEIMATGWKSAWALVSLPDASRVVRRAWRSGDYAVCSAVEQAAGCSVYTIASTKQALFAVLHIGGQRVIRFRSTDGTPGLKALTSMYATVAGMSSTGSLYMGAPSELDQAWAYTRVHARSAVTLRLPSPAGQRLRMLPGAWPADMDAQVAMLAAPGYDAEAQILDASLADSLFFVADSAGNASTYSEPCMHTLVTPAYLSSVAGGLCAWSALPPSVQLAAHIPSPLPVYAAAGSTFTLSGVVQSAFALRHVHDRLCFTAVPALNISRQCAPLLAATDASTSDCAYTSSSTIVCPALSGAGSARRVQFEAAQLNASLLALGEAALPELSLVYEPVSITHVSIEPDGASDLSDPCPWMARLLDYASAQYLPPQHSCLLRVNISNAGLLTHMVHTSVSIGDRTCALQGIDAHASTQLVHSIECASVRGTPGQAAPLTLHHGAQQVSAGKEMRWATPAILQVEPATLQVAHVSAAGSQTVAVLGAFLGNSTRAARMVFGTWQCPSPTFFRAVSDNLTALTSPLGTSVTLHSACTVDQTSTVEPRKLGALPCVWLVCSNVPVYALEQVATWRGALQVHVPVRSASGAWTEQTVSVVPNRLLLDYDSLPDTLSNITGISAKEDFTFTPLPAPHITSVTTPSNVDWLGDVAGAYNMKIRGYGLYWRNATYDSAGQYAGGNRPLAATVDGVQVRLQDPALAQHRHDVLYAAVPARSPASNPDDMRLCLHYERNATLCTSITITYRSVRTASVATRGVRAAGSTMWTSPCQQSEEPAINVTAALHNLSLLLTSETLLLRQEQGASVPLLLDVEVAMDSSLPATGVHFDVQFEYAAAGAVPVTCTAAGGTVALASANVLRCSGVPAGALPGPQSGEDTLRVRGMVQYQPSANYAEVTVISRPQLLSAPYFIHAGGEWARVQGSALLPGFALHVGRAPCTHTLWLSRSEALCYMPAGALAAPAAASSFDHEVSLNVSTLAGCAAADTASVSITYRTAVLRSISPRRVSPAAAAPVLTISGDGFLERASDTFHVSVGSLPCASTTVLSATSLRCTLNGSALAAVAGSTVQLQLLHNGLLVDPLGVSLDVAVQGAPRITRVDALEVGKGGSISFAGEDLVLLEDWSVAEVSTPLAGWLSDGAQQVNLDCTARSRTEAVCDVPLSAPDMLTAWNLTVRTALGTGVGPGVRVVTRVELPPIGTLRLRSAARPDVSNPSTVDIEFTWDGPTDNAVVFLLLPAQGSEILALWANVSAALPASLAGIDAQDPSAIVAAVAAQPEAARAFTELWRDAASTELVLSDWHVQKASALQGMLYSTGPLAHTTPYYFLLTAKRTTSARSSVSAPLGPVFPLCAPGTFVDDSRPQYTWRCEQCPYGLRCAGGDMLAARASAATTINGFASLPWGSGVSAFAQCRVAAACTHASSNATSAGMQAECRPGHEGVLCERCVPGYRLDLDGLCAPCAALGMQLFVVICTGIVGCVIVWSVTRNAQNSVAETAAPLAREAGVLNKLLLGHIAQVGIARSFDMEWPSMVSDFLGVMSIPTAAGSTALQVDCMKLELGLEHVPTFYLRAAGNISLPVLLSLYWVVFVLVSALCCRTKPAMSVAPPGLSERSGSQADSRASRSLSVVSTGGPRVVVPMLDTQDGAKAPAEIDDSTRSLASKVASSHEYEGLCTEQAHDSAPMTWQAALWQRIMLGWVVLAFVQHAGVTTNVLNLFTCTTLGTGDNASSRVYGDVSIACSSDEHRAWQLYLGVPALLLLVLGTPAMLLLLLSRARRAPPGSALSTSAGFLVVGYKPQYWFAELVIMARKSGLACMMVFLAPSGITVQVCLGILVLLGALVVQLRIRPYDIVRCNQVEEASLIISIITMVAGAMLAVEDGSVPGAWSVTVAVLTIAVNAVFIVVVAIIRWRASMLNALRNYQARRRQRKESVARLRAAHLQSLDTVHRSSSERTQLGMVAESAAVPCGPGTDMQPHVGILQPNEPEEMPDEAVRSECSVQAGSPNCDVEVLTVNALAQQPV